MLTATPSPHLPVRFLLQHIGTTETDVVVCIHPDGVYILEPYQESIIDFLPTSSIVSHELDPTGRLHMRGKAARRGRRKREIQLSSERHIQTIDDALSILRTTDKFASDAKE